MGQLHSACTGPPPRAVRGGERRRVRVEKRRGGSRRHGLYGVAPRRSGTASGPICEKANVELARINLGITTGARVELPNQALSKLRVN